MSNTKFSNYKSEDGNTGPDLVGITSFTSPYYFVPPSGTTAQRPSNAVPGQLRFNTDIGRLEVWRGDHWATILGESPNLNGGARGVFGGGYFAPTAANNSNVIDYVSISSLGNAIDFGDLTQARRGLNSCASSTRGLFTGGYVDTAPTNGYKTRIDFITISSTGNAATFGDLSGSRFTAASCSSSTRGVIGGGENGVSPASNVIDYVTIASTGNAQDFGDMYTGTTRNYGSCSSSVRGIFAGGDLFPTLTNVIQYITISTLGNSIDFGDLLSAGAHRSCSNSTRGLFLDGIGNNIISFITIASLGNAQDFGDITVIRGASGACASPTRGLFGGGGTGSNVIDYVTILSTGNAVDFGDLTQARTQTSACSNGHGGL